MTTVRRRGSALVMIGVGGVAALVLGAPGAADAQAPTVASWWNAANVGPPAPAPPAPPDVKPGDLLVQGSNAVPAAATLPLSNAPTGSEAVAGLSYTLAPTDIVGALRLDIDGTPPPQVSVVACQATERVKAETNGPWADVPAYDSTACDSGKLKGSTVVFADVSRLVASGRLALVLLPGPVDRVVFKKPTAASLQVRNAGGVGAAAPPLGSDNGAGTAPSGGSAAPIGGGTGGGAVTPPTVGGLPPASTASTPTDTPPVVAGQPAAPAANPAAARVAAAASGGLSTGARRAIALAILALEAVGFVLLTRTAEPPPVVAGGAAGAAGAVAGGRFRPPDRVVGTSRPAEAATVGGVGRFRRERTAPAPQL